MPVNPTQRRELAFLLVTAMLVATMAVLAGRFDLVSGKRSELLYDKTYAGGQSWGPMDRADGAWQPTSRGLAVEPGRSGTLTIRVANDVESQLIALVFGRAGTEAAILLEVSTDGQRFRVASERPALDGTRIDLSRWSGAGEQVWVRITASAATAPVEVARVRLVRLKRPLTFPNLPIAALMILAPVLAYVVRSRTRRSGAMSYGLLVLGAMSMLTEAIASTRVPDSQQQWWELVVVSQTRDGYYLAPYGILLLLGGWQAKVWLPGSVDARLWGAFALGGILAWGGSSRLAAFSEMGGSQLGPDAMTYMH